MYKYLAVLLLIYSQINLAKTIILPIVLDQNGLPMIKLTIADTSYDFVLDTGSKVGFHLTKELMSNTPTLKLTGEKQKSIDLLGKIMNNDKFIIEQFVIDGMLFKHIDGVEYQLWGLTLNWGNPDIEPEQSANPVDTPIIGLGLFHDHRVIIDYSQRLLIIDDKQPAELIALDSDWIELPFQLNEEGLAIEVMYQDNNYTLGLDTGSTFSLIKSDVLPKNSKLDSCAIIAIQTDDSNDEEQGDGLCKVANLKIAHLATDVPIYAILLNELPIEFKSDGLLGTNFLQHFAVMFDLSDQKLMLKPITYSP